MDIYKELRKIEDANSNYAIQCYASWACDALIDAQHACHYALEDAVYYFAPELAEDCDDETLLMHQQDFVDSRENEKGYKQDLYQYSLFLYQKGAMEKSLFDAITSFSGEHELSSFLTEQDERLWLSLQVEGVFIEIKGHFWELLHHIDHEISYIANFLYYEFDAIRHNQENAIDIMTFCTTIEYEVAYANEAIKKLTELGQKVDPDYLQKVKDSWERNS